MNEKILADVTGLVAESCGIYTDGGDATRHPCSLKMLKQSMPYDKEGGQK